jgi:rRNA maturation RNase YbeY
MSTRLAPSISFFSEDVEFVLPNEEVTARWLADIAIANQKGIRNLNYIFVSDEHLLQLNESYLQHDTLTDVITFQYNQPDDDIEGDIFISIDRVEENANDFNTAFINELNRVMAHGMLHLLGFSDKTDSEKIHMRTLEDHYLALLSHLS